MKTHVTAAAVKAHFGAQVRCELPNVPAMNFVMQHALSGGVTALQLESWDVAWTLRAGSRLRLDISSSNFPEYSIHPNTKTLWSEASQTRVAHQTLYFGGDAPACVELPAQQDGANA